MYKEYAVRDFLHYGQPLKKTKTNMVTNTKLLKNNKLFRETKEM